MNSVIKRLAMVLLSLFLLAYVGYQAYLALYNPVTTQRATLQTAEDEIALNGFVLHDESLIQADVQGIIDYDLPDGVRVEKNGVVASVYPTAEEAADERKIRELDNKIAQLQVNAVAGNTMAVDINVLNADVDGKFQKLSDIAASGDVESLGSAEADFLNLLNEKQIVTGKTANFTDKLRQLQSERQSLAASLSGNVKQIASSVSGYFVSHADGYESIYDPKNIQTITPAQVKSLFAAKPTPTKAVGKVVSSYEWYIVCVMGSDQAHRLKINGSVQVSFPFLTEGAVPATVVAANGDSSGSYAVVLRCDYMTGDLAVERQGSVSINLGEYTGLRVENSNIHIQNNQKGVYILDGSIARFKKLDIVYCGDNYVISKNDPYDASKLQVNDRVIIGGRNIYDGRVLK